MDQVHPAKLVMRSIVAECIELVDAYLDGLSWWEFDSQIGEKIDSAREFEIQFSYIIESLDRLRERCNGINLEIDDEYYFLYEFVLEE